LKLEQVVKQESEPEPEPELDELSMEAEISDFVLEESGDLSTIDPADAEPEETADEDAAPDAMVEATMDAEILESEAEGDPSSTVEPEARAEPEAVVKPKPESVAEPTTDSLPSGALDPLVSPKTLPIAAAGKLTAAIPAMEDVPKPTVELPNPLDQPQLRRLKAAGGLPSLRGSGLALGRTGISQAEAAAAARSLVQAVQKEHDSPAPEPESSRVEPATRNNFRGPDPTGEMRDWEFNPRDGWSYTKGSSWLYNHVTQVYFDGARQVYCKYDLTTGLVPGECVPDKNGDIHFVPNSVVNAAPLSPIGEVSALEVSNDSVHARLQASSVEEREQTSQQGADMSTVAQDFNDALLIEAVEEEYTDMEMSMDADLTEPGESDVEFEQDDFDASKLSELLNFDTQPKQPLVSSNSTLVQRMASTSEQQQHTEPPAPVRPRGADTRSLLSKMKEMAAMGAAGNDGASGGGAKDATSVGTVASLRSSFEKKVVDAGAPSSSSSSSSSSSRDGMDAEARRRTKFKMAFTKLRDDVTATATTSTLDVEDLEVVDESIESPASSAASPTRLKNSTIESDVAAYDEDMVEEFLEESLSQSFDFDSVQVVTR
jgi:hypothetical protein